jgi:hypothetical protein
VALLTTLLLLGMVACQNDPVATDQAVGAASQNATASEAEDYTGGEPFDDAEAFFEFNTTDNDLGLQIFLDAEGWRQVTVRDPSKRKIVQIAANGPLSEIGITELRFEGAEPSPAEVLALFPPGDYEFGGKLVEGGKLFSVAELSHDFLPAPTFSPSGGQVVDPNNTVVTWSAPGAEEVEVIIEDEESGRVLDIIVPGDIDSLTVPAEFLEPDTEYKLEILAIAENGNRTIAEGFFMTMP